MDYKLKREAENISYIIDSLLNAIDELEVENEDLKGQIKEYENTITRLDDKVYDMEQEMALR